VHTRNSYFSQLFGQILIVATYGMPAKFMRLGIAGMAALRQIHFQQTESKFAEETLIQWEFIQPVRQLFGNLTKSKDLFRTQNV
jgi:hypothetical protein